MASDANKDRQSRLFQKLLFVDNCDGAAVKLKHVVIAQLFHDPIGVDGGDSHGFPNFVPVSKHSNRAP